MSGPDAERTPAWLWIVAVVAILAVPVLAAVARVESFSACAAANGRAACVDMVR